MVDRTSKNPGPAPEHRLNIILEELQSQFRSFGEGLADVQEKVSELPEIKERLGRVEDDVKLIKSVIPTLATKKDLEPLATKKDLEKLEKRLTALETH